MYKSIESTIIYELNKMDKESKFLINNKIYTAKSLINEIDNSTYIGKIFVNDLLKNIMTYMMKIKK